MRKSGLHKKISFIFDGAEVPNQERPEQASQGTAGTQSGVSDTVAGTQPEKPLPAQQRPENTASAAPALPTQRPAPLPKRKLNHEASGSAISKRVQQTVFGSEKKISPHQKKMTVLVGILSIVFGVVMYISLGGVGHNQTIAAPADDDTGSAAVSSSKVTPQSWTVPAPVPANLRDATVPKAKTQTVSGDPKKTDDLNPAQLQVRGIVYSRNKPSAIINDGIYKVGESINGITITAITRNDVTFETNGKSWTQQVQHKDD